MSFIAAISGQQTSAPLVKQLPKYKRTKLIGIPANREGESVPLV
jgi:hypothetical protein